MVVNIIYWLHTLVCAILIYSATKATKMCIENKSTLMQGWTDTWRA